MALNFEVTPHFFRSGGTDAAVPNHFRFFVVSFILHPDFLVVKSGVQKVSHNVPAVYDGLAARIRKCVAFPGPTNCAGATAWE
jgi:hypothetical protein